MMVCRVRHYVRPIFTTNQCRNLKKIFFSLLDVTSFTCTQDKLIQLANITCVHQIQNITTKQAELTQQDSVYQTLKNNQDVVSQRRCWLIKASLLQYVTMVISLMFTLEVEEWLKWKLAWPTSPLVSVDRKFWKDLGIRPFILASSPRHMLALQPSFFSGSATISLVRSCMEQDCNSQCTGYGRN